MGHLKNYWLFWLGLPLPAPHTTCSQRRSLWSFLESSAAQPRLLNMSDCKSTDPVCEAQNDNPTSQTRGICNRCKNLICAWESTPLGLGRAFGCTIYETTELLELTAEDGCSICQLFLEGISTTDRARLRQNKYQPRDGEKPIISRYHRWAAGDMRSVRLQHYDDAGNEFATVFIRIKNNDGMPVDSDLECNFAYWS